MGKNAEGKCMQKQFPLSVSSVKQLDWRKGECSFPCNPDSLCIRLCNSQIFAYEVQVQFLLMGDCQGMLAILHLLQLTHWLAMMHPA